MRTQFLTIVVSLFFYCSLSDAQWMQTSLTSSRVNTILVSDTNLFAGTHSNGIYISNDNGLNWIAVNNGLTTSRVQALTVFGTNLFAASYGGGVFRSTDNGSSWNTVNNGLTNPFILAFSFSETNIFVGTEGGVFRSTNNGSSWSLANNGNPSSIVLSLAVAGTNLFAGFNGSGIYISTNNGLNWSAVNNGLNNPYIHSLAISGNNLFAGSEGGIIYISTNNGSNWSGTNVGSGTSTFYTFAFSGTNIFAGAWGGGVFLSTDNGLSWSTINTGLTDTDVLSLAVKGDTLFAGTFSNGVWKRPLSEIIPVELVSFGANVNASKVVLNWNTATEINNSGFQIERSKKLRYEQTDWEALGFVAGFGTSTEPKSYSFIDENLSYGKYKYRLKQIDFDGTFEFSNVVEVEVTSPSAFSLEQNYPNPFNPSTEISWQSTVGSHQTLKVYDVLGSELATLVDEYREAGRYEIEYDARNLSSGIYFYKLQAGDFISTKKMILIK